METCVKDSQEKSSQRCPWILFAVAILFALGLLVRVELVARDTKKLAQEFQQLRRSLKETVAPQDLKQEDVDAVRGRRQVFHFVIFETYKHCRWKEKGSWQADRVKV